ncbi:MAG TPA: long-chain fatty acid--CoA ligase [Casimicrobiaceae bacterium]
MDLSDWIDRHADFAPAKEALRFEGEAITYRDLAEQIARTAGMLHTLGIARGVAVAYLGLNTPAMLALLFACARLGAMLVPFNWRLAPPEHRRVLDDCVARALFAEAPFVATIDAIRKGTDRADFVTLGTAAPGWKDGASLLCDAPPVLAGQGSGDYDAPTLLCYTSGSTGAPKGVVLTQRALFWNAVNSTLMHDLTRADRILTTLPLFHVGGLNILTLPALHAGATVVLHPKFDAEATLEAIATERITLMVLVPAQLDMLLQHPRWQQANLSSLRCISTGSMIVPPRLFEAMRARGVPLIQVYGATETAPIATYTAVADAPDKAGSAGKPAVHCGVRIVGASGDAVSRGVSGEIVVKGPNVMSGYWNAPAATADALRDGWFHTGDIGHFDGDGFLWVDGRAKDMIISGGENIYPAEIENALAASPDIAEVAVVGRPDAKWGEIVVAVVVPRPGCELRDQDVLDLLHGRIARFKHPRKIVFLPELPRSALGKVRKDELRRIVRGEALA